jgi:hypothetical protein
MAKTDTDLTRPATGVRRRYRIIIPALTLAVFAGFALLWVAGWHSTYFGALRFVGIEPFRFPFLDLHAILAAGECHQQKIDVYLTNPCDVLGRPHVYSPLWLSILPDFLGTADTRWIGLALDVLFLLSLGFIFHPRGRYGLAVFTLAAFSPTTFYAVERANNDVIVFLLVLGGCLLVGADRAKRLAGQTLWLLAGLLKYYPLVLLVFIAGERLPSALLPAGVAGLAVLLFGLHYHGELSVALGNIPAPSYFTDSFAAKNLPYGLAEGLTDLSSVSATAIALVLLAMLTVLMIMRSRRTVRLFDDGAIDWTGWDMHCLAVGGLLLAACFFCGQNISYRGIFFLLALPGLIHLRAAGGSVALKQWSSIMIAAALFLMWNEFIRRWLHASMAALTDQWLGNRIEILFWVGRELVWWWLIAGLMAIVFVALRSLPLVQEVHAYMRRKPAAAR